jgi:4-diphosphocytidyl-2-C-methyl-D-erythritol kinase
VSLPVLLGENAPAKVNLTLRVLRRRDDGYHEIESLVTFADFGDRLTLSPGDELTLTVRGPTAGEAGEGADNLVLKATRALAAQCPGIVCGAFNLDKTLPVAAGLGGGSADAAAALRLIARANGLAPDDPRLHAAARATGADVPVCLDPRPRLMRGIGEILSDPLSLPPFSGVLVNPGVPLATKPVFAGWTPAASPVPVLDPAALANLTNQGELLRLLETQANDLEVPAIALAPAVAEVLTGLRNLPGCRLARMSGSGATCFGLFADPAKARQAAKALQDKYPHWWIRAGTLGKAP